MKIKKSIYWSLPLLLISCGESSGENNFTSSDNIPVDSNQIQETIEDSDMSVYCGTIDSLDHKAFKLKGTKNEQNTYSRTKISGKDSKTEIEIGRHLLFTKSEGTKKTDFSGKLITEIKNESETTVLFIYFNDNGLVPGIGIGNSREAILGEGQVTINDWLILEECFEGHKIFVAFDGEDKVQCIGVFNLEYESYFTQDDLVGHIEEAVKIRTDNEKN